MKNTTQAIERFLSLLCKNKTKDSCPSCESANTGIIGFCYDCGETWEVVDE